MKKQIFFILTGFLFVLSACQPAPAAVQPTMVATIAIPTTTPIPPTPTITLTPTNTRIPPTETPTLTPTLSYPIQGRGPTGFEASVNPLTGLEVDNPQLLERRPILIKVENLPREHRPQWGLSVADLVYEYYTEFGATRFAALFYGNDAERVGPIRSGRFFDANLVQMYRSIFVYGSAYQDVQSRFFNSDYYQRLVLETTKSCPALCRFDPNGVNLLVANTAELQPYLASRNVENSRQTLDGMFFKAQIPLGGSQANQVYVRYSGAIYNRWDYDPSSGRYLRFVDAANDVNRNAEVYAPLTDALTSQPVGAENVVTICAPHQYYVKRDDAEVLDIIMDAQRINSYPGCDGNLYTGDSGAAYVARDGQVYPATWRREKRDTILTLYNLDGTAFALKPGQTWFEVIGASSIVEQQGGNAWRFEHHMVP